MSRLSTRFVLSWAAAAALLVALSACGTTSASPPPPPVQGLSLTCPASATATAPVGSTSAAVTYAAPTVTGGTPPVSVACTPASGSLFPLGTTAVNCNGTDAIGRTAVCSTSVVVKSHSIGISSVVAFGDSITAGENGVSGSPTFIAPPTCPSTAAVGPGALRPLGGESPQFIDLANSYPTLLLNTLSADFSQTFTVDNRGWPLENTTQGVPRLACVLGIDHPDTLLLLEGINDLAGAGFSQASMAQVTANLQTDIQNAHAMGVINIFVGTLLPNGTCTAPVCRGSISNNPSIAAANSQIAAMVAGQAGLGATLVDVNAAYVAGDNAGFTTLIDTDGLHPTPAGNAVTAKAFFTAIIAKAPVLSIRRLHR